MFKEKEIKVYEDKDNRYTIYACEAGFGRYLGGLTEEDLKKIKKDIEKVLQSENK